MSRVRTIYPNQGIFVGPSPDTGFHFLSYSGVLNDNYTDLITNHNLLQEIERVQSVSYGIDINRTDVKQLGTRSLVARPVVNYPTIQLSFDYLLKGVINEARIGFGVNYARFEYPFSGQPFYPNRISPISGFVDRHLNRVSGDLPYWPFSYRDKRNIFIPITTEGNELHQNKLPEDFSYPDLLQQRDPNATGYQVIAFGGCYLDGYSTSAQVGAVPSASVSYTCDNIAFYTSGSGFTIPSVNTRTRQPINDKHVVIPQPFNSQGPHILFPGDITIDLSSTGNAGLNNFGFNYSDIKINSYSIQFGLNRQSLDSLGYKLPVDRVPTFPIIVGLGFSAVVGEEISGSCLGLINQDSNYDITIKLKNPTCIDTGNASNPKQDGPFNSASAVAIRYDFAGTLCKSVSYKDQIGANKMVNFSFESEIDPDVTGRGFFMSGLLNVAKVQDYLLNDSDNSYLLYPDDNSPIVLGLPPLF